MTDARRSALRTLAALRPDLAAVRRAAVLACAAHWLAAHGAPLSHYLQEVDRLDALLAEAEAELETAA